MDLLIVIQNAVLQQLEEEARNFFSQVSDFRRFISHTRPSPDVVTTLKLRCFSADRLNCGQGTCFVGIDAIHGALSYHSALEKNMYAKIIVWDCDTLQGGNVDFITGALYVFRQVEYVGIYDGVAKGCVVYDPTCDSQIEQVAPPLRRSQLRHETSEETY